MSYPGFSAGSTLGSPTGALRLERRASPEGANGGDVLVPQSCDFWEWMSCAGTIAGCAIACTYRPSDCFDCFKRAGKEVCYSCV